ncbi:hypothetical protein Cgig2_014235 [Carnegiea gigantea]|uniref:DUF4283 domain-containing protein n=1 Tax=Carnegiea gigantea TaxID=171969 RepID=A0A9Q1K0U3_9CARY|nr:hypothetical protein Cgig2_014235 [Carnegiea gigantea]
MELELEVVWHQLKLTEEEEEILISVDEVPSEKAEQVALCLLGRLHTSNYFNLGALKTVLKDIWKPTNWAVIKEVEKNLFAFQFFSRAVKDFVLEEGPRSFDGSLLLLKEMYGLEQPSEIDFSTAHSWIKAYDVPGLKQTPTFAKLLGDKLPDFCCACGKLGHVYKGCVLFDPIVPENDLQYGSWLRASPLKPRGKTAEADRLEE